MDLLELLYHDLVKVLQRSEDSGSLAGQKDRVSQLYLSHGRSLPRGSFLPFLYLLLISSEAPKVAGTLG